MIEWLEIRNLAIAEHVALEFKNAFTTVTGETGSGKSLIVDAVAVLLGGRAETATIAKGADEAIIQGQFALTDAHPAVAWMTQHQLAHNNDCILRRVVRRDKSSLAFINGKVVTASQMRELGEELVEIHSQNEHHALLSRKGQLAVLDSAAGNGELLRKLGLDYAQLTDLQARMTQLKNLGNMTRERAELLKVYIEDLEKLAPTIDEWPRLAQQQKRVHHNQDLSLGARTVLDSLNAEGGVTSILSDCARKLQRLAEYDSRLAKVIELFEEAEVNLSETTPWLQEVAEEGALDPAEIAAIEARFSSYHELSRKHQVLPGLLAEKLQQLREELAGLADPKSELKRLQNAWQQHKASYDASAAELSKNRAQAVQHITAGVLDLMPELGIQGGNFAVKLHPNQRDAGATSISRRGNEGAEFLVSANPGQPLQPLNKVASGGELSRISLAINVVLATNAPASTLFFDEVDVGIGGKVADVVGQKLRELGQNRQIICITHLSQVAAKGHHHWSVAKQTDEFARVVVTPLTHAQRVEEIARMTAGAELTPQSLAHAEQLLQPQ